MDSEQRPLLTKPTKLPSSELKRIKQAIRTLDLCFARDDEIARLIQRLMYGYGLSFPTIKPPLRLYRGRACTKPKNISELSYPPPNKAPIGRANRAGDPVFYCSTDSYTPSFEAALALGDFYALSCWETTVTLTVNAVGYTRSAFEKLDSERANCGWDFAHTDEDRAQFLAELFTETVPVDIPYRYRFTSALAEMMTRDLFDGIMYPTVARYANGENFALKRAYADSLKFLQVRFWVLKELMSDSRGRANGRKVFTELDCAREVAKDGTIKWLGPGALGSFAFTANVANPDEAATEQS